MISLRGITLPTLPRLVPITNPEQLTVLEAAYELVGRSSRASLIPRHKKYIQQRNRYDYECKRIGLSAAHGLRHEYAQRRYRELTGYDAPIRGGEAPADIDGKARDEITEELGHGRREIVASYVGRLVRETETGRRRT